MKKEVLHKIAPKLSEISPKETGFVIPENYFDAVEDEISAKIIAEKLMYIKKYSAFEIPKNYFDSVEDIILTKLKAEALQNDKSAVISATYFDTIEDTVLNKINTKTTGLSINRSIIKYLAPVAVAASFLLIIMLNKTTETLTFDSITTSEIEYWIDNSNVDIDALSIASIYSDIDLENESFSTSLSEDEVLDYLSDEYLDEIIYEN